MKSIASVMATIAVLSAVASTAIATGFTLYSNAERNTYSNTGADLVYYGGDSDLNEKIHRVFAENHVKIEQEETIKLYEAVSEAGNTEAGSDRNFFVSDSLRVYSETEYNKLLAASKSNLDPVRVKTGEADYISPVTPDDDGKAILGLTLEFRDSEIRIVKVSRANFPGMGIYHTVVLSDRDFKTLAGNGSIYPSADSGNAGATTMMNYRGGLSNSKLNADLTAVLTGSDAQYESAYNLYNESMQIFGLICFIGFFMSGVFILMTASLLYFKQVTAAEEESHQYKMLRRIGMDEKTERQVIKKRLVPVFFIPLAIGIVHSIFAMKTADTVIFSNMIPVENSYLSVLGFSAVMYAAYALVYCVFYLITKSQYSRIVRN
jgi:putative ABC transport system permease protein